MKYFEYTLAGQPCFCHMNKYPTVFKTVFRERHPHFHTGWVFHASHCTVGPLTEVSQHHHKGKQHSPAQSCLVMIHSKVWVFCSKVWVFCSALTCPAHSDHTVLSVTEMCSQGSAQFSPLTSQGGLLAFEQTFTQNLPQRSSVQVARSGYQPYINSRKFPVLSVDM